MSLTKRKATALSGNTFSKVKEAREALKERTQELIDAYLENAAAATAAEQFDVAEKSLRWLLEHLPADQDGERVVDVGVDTKAKAGSEAKPTGPSINIGFAIGGVNDNKKRLPSVTVIPDEAESEAGIDD